MNAYVKTISVCVITFNRNQLLSACLQSVLKSFEIIDDKYQIILNIVDNNPTQEAKPVVDKFKNYIGLKINYYWEKNPGIPFARNACLDLSLKENSDYIIFIDDDEEADINWLKKLIETIESNQVDVVSGIVLTKDQKNVSQNKIIKKMQRDRAETNNVIFKRWIAEQVRFYEKMAQTGGTDTLFFRQAYRFGAKIIYCKEAIVYETIPDIRKTSKWILRRNFRNGLTHVTIEKIINDNKSYKLKLIFKSALMIILSILELFPRFFIGGKNGALIAMKRFARAVGIISGFLNFDYKEYKRG